MAGKDRYQHTRLCSFCKEPKSFTKRVDTAEGVKIHCTNPKCKEAAQAASV